MLFTGGDEHSSSTPCSEEETEDLETHGAGPVWRAFCILYTWLQFCNYVQREMKMHNTESRYHFPSSRPYNPPMASSGNCNIFSVGQVSYVSAVLSAFITED